MESIRRTLLTNWHFMRWFRLGVGIFIAVQAIQLQHIILGLVAFFFLYQAITGSGCCGSRGCALDVRKHGKDDSLPDRGEPAGDTGN